MWTILYLACKRLRFVYMSTCKRLQYFLNSAALYATTTIVSSGPYNIQYSTSHRYQSCDNIHTKFEINRDQNLLTVNTSTGYIYITQKVLNKRFFFY